MSIKQNVGRGRHKRYHYDRMKNETVVFRRFFSRKANLKSDLKTVVHVHGKWRVDLEKRGVRKEFLNIFNKKAKKVLQMSFKSI